MVINAANVRSTIYIINIYNILSVCLRGWMKAGTKGSLRSSGTGKVGLSVFSVYFFFLCCFPSLSAVLCKYLRNCVLYI